MKIPCFPPALPIAPFSLHVLISVLIASFSLLFSPNEQNRVTIALLKMPAHAEACKPGKFASLQM